LALFAILVQLATIANTIVGMRLD